MWLGSYLSLVIALLGVNVSSTNDVYLVMFLLSSTPSVN